MATIPGMGGSGRSEMRIDPAVQAERDQERLAILRQEQSDTRYPEDVRAAVGREIGRMGATPAASAEAPQQRYPAVPVDPAYEELKRRYAGVEAKTHPPDGMVGLYGRQLDTAMQRRLADPGPAPEASWDTWANIKAFAGSGLVRGGLEYSGSVADLASGAAAPLASTGGSAGGMFTLPSDAELQQEEAARQRMLKGPAFDTTMGGVMRAKANEWAPDPLTAHRSTEIISGLSAGLTKAVGSALTFGPIPGAIVFGAEEANTTAQNLIEVDKVDPATAAKVGAVVGVASAVGAALPVAGRTLAKTAALAAVGGPGTFVAQETLSRKILQEAAYTAQAEMHDPTDPVMLALSTVIPGAMGAVAMRSAARAAARNKAMQPVREAVRVEADAQALAEVAGVPRQSEVIIQDAAAPRQPTEAQIDAAARDAATNLETVDAARVRALEAAESRHIPPETPPGNEAGIDSVRAAVESGDMGPVKAMMAAQEARAPLQTDTPQFKAWFGDSQVVDAQGAPLVVYHGTNRSIDAFDLSKLDASEGIHLAADPAVASGYSVSRDMGGRGGSNVMPLYVRAEKIQDVPIITSNGAREAQQAGFDAIRSGTHIVVFDPARIKSAIGNSGRFDPQSGNLTDPNVPARVRTLADTAPGEEPPAVVREAGAAGLAADRAAPTAMPLDLATWEGEGDMPGADGALPGVRFGDAGAVTKIDPATTATEGATHDASAVSKLEQSDPDMMVTLPGSEAPMRLAEAMELVRAQAQEMRQDGDLFTAAAECLLMSGL